MLSETHIRPTAEVSVLNVTGYTFLSLPRKTDSGGGVGLYISNINAVKISKMQI